MLTLELGKAYGYGRDVFLVVRADGRSRVRILWLTDVEPGLRAVTLVHRDSMLARWSTELEP